MKIGFIATRLCGTDGVSLEVAKWVRILKNLGHEPYFCAGELGGYAAGGTLIPQMHFQDESIQAINRAAFGPDADKSPDQLLEKIHLEAKQLKTAIQEFIRSNQIELIIIQNALAIPMNLPLGVCLTELIQETGFPVIAHHHDFFWERERYQGNAILDLLDTYFPPKLASIQHVTINTIAQEKLKLRRGIDSLVIPNVYDFSSPPPFVEEKHGAFRQSLKLPTGTPLILQPTRVIQRKGIELAIELVSRMELDDPNLIITHSAGDEGFGYYNWLQREAHMMGVSLKLVDFMMGDEAGGFGGFPIFTLADAYLSADLVTYPSIYEGFGNALLEAVYYKRQVVINRYPVYNSDIRPLGFQFIELDGYVDDRAIELSIQAIKYPETTMDMIEANYQIARDHFSMEVLENKILQLIGL